MAAHPGLPMSVQRAFKDLLLQCIKMAQDNSQFLELVYSVDSEAALFIRFNTTIPGYPFYYAINHPHLPGGLNQKPSADFIRNPRSEDLLQEFSKTIPIENIVSSIEGWISILKTFYEFSYDPAGDIEKKYAREYFLEFKSTDPDADTMPFDDEKQVHLIKFLEYVEKGVDDYPDKNEQILEIGSEAKILRNNVQRLPKNKVLEYLGNLGAKIRMQGPDVLKGLLKTGKDETIKFIIKQVLEGGKHLIENWHQYIN